jgi:diguanylate cyclase (GGDEF)-like protein
MTSPGPDNEDIFQFADAQDSILTEEDEYALPPWRILIIDDDEDVHQATLFALKGLVLFGRSLAFLHAYSAVQAKEMLLHETDLALVFLDVVMETPDAGLQLVGFLRDQAKLSSTRIILRTGQPGYAPEHETILQYDINDYKTKSELTHHKLLTSVTASLRAYEQLQVIEAGRRGLELIVNCSGGFLNYSDLRNFAAGVITHMSALLRTSPDGVVCAHHNDDADPYTIVAAAGKYLPCVSQALTQLDDPKISKLLATALQSKESYFGKFETVLYFGDLKGWAMATYVATHTPLLAIDQDLLSVFSVNLSSALSNFGLVERLHNDAYVDSLLHLPNRTSLIEELTATLQSDPSDSVLALIDIDDFAEVNDLMGHAYGDHLLKAVAKCLIDEFGNEVLVARVSSDSFGMLGSAQSISYERIKHSIDGRAVVAGQPHLVSVTIGMAPRTSEVSTGIEWLKDAGITLKHAKRNHRGRFAVYSQDMAQVARQRALLLEGLHKAFGDGQLFMVYQPQVNLASGELIGLEALIRWRTATGLFIPPDQFIPVAEHSGLIVAMGDWILQTACADMRRLKSQGLERCHMAVNVSVVQFQADGFLDRVVKTLQKHQLQPQDLELEITESVAMLGRDVVDQVLSQLRAIGVAVAIDDFGTGYSSLSYLEQLPVDRIKIDRSFVMKLSGPGGPRIAEMITQLGHKLELKVLAEGIEDAQTWRALSAMGCDEGQGYFLSRPLAIDDLQVWLNQWSTQFASMQLA